MPCLCPNRKLQEDLTDEMVVLAQQLKENSLLMNRSLQDTEKVLGLIISLLMTSGFCGSSGFGQPPPGCVFCGSFH